MAVTTSVDICNLALSFLKIPAITSITSLVAPQKEVKEVCAQWYDPSRLESLRAHPWNFAKDRAQLVLDATAPTFGYASRYPLPTGFCRLRFIGEDNYGLIGEEYDLEGGYILTDITTATLDIGYIKDVTDVTEFDPLFVNYFALIMAKNICFGVTGKSVLRRDIREMILEIGNQARAVNGQDKPPIRVTRSRVLGARRTYSGGSAQVIDPKYMPLN